MNVAASLKDSRQSNARFNPVVFILASLAAAVTWFRSSLSRNTSQSRHGGTHSAHRWARSGSLPQALSMAICTISCPTLPTTATASMLALEPLVRFHSANPNMVDRGGVAHFVLDPAASPHLHSSHKLKASAYMERFNNPKEYDDGWLEQIAAGKTYVTPEFEHDEYGDFLSGHPAHRRRQSEEDQRPSRSRCWRCGHCLHCRGHPPKYPRG